MTEPLDLEKIPDEELARLERNVRADGATTWWFADDEGHWHPGKPIERTKDKDVTTHNATFEYALAQLRHLYEQMVGGYVVGEQDPANIARGILGPAIQYLESVQAVNYLADEDTTDDLRRRLVATDQSLERTLTALTDTQLENKKLHADVEFLNRTLAQLIKEQSEQALRSEEQIKRIRDYDGRNEL